MIRDPIAAEWLDHLQLTISRMSYLFFTSENCVSRVGDAASFKYTKSLLQTMQRKMLQIRTGLSKKNCAENDTKIPQILLSMRD